MNGDKKQIEGFTILMAEDDEDDRLIIDQAFVLSGVSGTLHFVNDGEELLDYLRHCAQYVESTSFPRPSCILLDLNMPRKSGREVLQEIRNNPDLKDLRVIVLTTSDSDDDKRYCSRLGVSDYVTKSGSFKSFVDLMTRIEVLCVA